MPGVQVHHATLRNQTLVLEHPDQPYPEPFACSVCETFHTNKAIHLRFDGVGDCVVAEEAWVNIEPLVAGQVTATKVIPQPEPMVIGMTGGRREVFQVVRMED